MNGPVTTRILVVSLTRSKERRRAFAERARVAGVEWKYFDALEGLAPGLEYDEPEAILRTGRPLSRNEQACYSSHWAIWNRLLADDARQYIVLEDDVVVDWSMIRRLAAIDFAAAGVDYLRLYYKSAIPVLVRQRRYVTRSHALVELFDAAYGTQGYLITRAAAETLVPYCRRVVRAVDVQLDRFWDHGVPNLAIFPFPIVEEAGDSTIGDERFTALDRSPRRKLAILSDIVGRRLGAARRRRVRRDWRLPPPPGRS